MFSGRLPDHLLQAGTVIDEVVAFDAIVEDKEPLKTILARLHTDKLHLTSALNTILILLLSRRSLLAHRFGALASRRLVRRS